MTKNQKENAEAAIPLTPKETFWRSIFDRADIDKDGFIDVKELHKMIKHNDFGDINIPPEIIRRIHGRSDTNDDGRLDFSEFVAMVNNPENQRVFGSIVNKYVNLVMPRRNLGSTDECDCLYEDEYSCCPPRFGMILISIIEFIFFFIDEWNEKDSTKMATGPMAQTLIYDPTKRSQIWRFLTYMFVHIGYLHLVVNLAVQIFIGIPLEMVHGWWRILIIYSAGVIAGSLGTSITDPTAKLAGASGGVYSLITAHIASIIMNWKEMTFPLVQLIIFLLITGVDVGTSIYNRYVQHVNEHIGYVAHFAGAAAGLLVGINVLRNLQVTKKEKYVWWISFTTYGILMVFAIGWNLFYSDYFPKSG